LGKLTFIQFLAYVMTLVSQPFTTTNVNWDHNSEYIETFLYLLLTRKVKRYRDSSESMLHLFEVEGSISDPMKTICS